MRTLNYPDWMSFISSDTQILCLGQRCSPAYQHLPQALQAALAAGTLHTCPNPTPLPLPQAWLLPLIFRCIGYSWGQWIVRSVRREAWCCIAWCHGLMWVLNEQKKIDLAVSRVNRRTWTSIRRGFRWSLRGVWGAQTLHSALIGMEAVRCSGKASKDSPIIRGSRKES